VLPIHRFFVNISDITKDAVTLKGKNVAHGGVLRLKIGEQIVICDGNGRDYFCVVRAMDKTQICGEILRVEDNIAEPQIAVTLFQALPEGDKLADIVEKCVELGVTQVVPVVTARCIVKTSARDSKKTERLRAIAEAAAKQSGRGKIPMICEALSLQAAIEQAKTYDTTFACYESEDKLLLKNLLKPMVGKLSTLAFFVGPEGGFAQEEIAMFTDAKIPTVSLGNRILRTETAGPAVLANILYELEVYPCRYI